MIISTHALSLFLLKNDQNGVFNRNLRSIQESMCSDKPTGSKFKQVCTYFPNIALLTKSAMPGEVQVTYAHTSIGNNGMTDARRQGVRL